MFQESAKVTGRDLYILRVEDSLTSEYEWPALSCFLFFCFSDYTVRV